MHRIGSAVLQLRSTGVLGTAVLLTCTVGSALLAGTATAAAADLRVCQQTTQTLMPTIACCKAFCMHQIPWHLQ